jgi:hypothetical protein
MMKNKVGMERIRYDGRLEWRDALAGSMEEALERQQEVAETQQTGKDISSQQECERKAKDESMRLSRAHVEEQ